MPNRLERSLAMSLALCLAGNSLSYGAVSFRFSAPRFVNSLEECLYQKEAFSARPLFLGRAPAKESEDVIRLLPKAAETEGLTNPEIRWLERENREKWRSPQSALPLFTINSGYSEIGPSRGSSVRLQEYEKGFVEKWFHALDLRHTEVKDKDLISVRRLYGRYGRTRRVRGIAVIAQLPEEAREAIYEENKDIWDRMPNVLQLKIKRVLKDFSHLTLAFKPLTGPLEPNAIEPLIRSVSSVASSMSRLQFLLGPTNFFREEKAEHVLVKEVLFRSDNELDRFDTLREKLLEIMHAAPRARYLYHISWAYIWSTLNLQELGIVMDLLGDARTHALMHPEHFIPVTINEISLQEMNGFHDITEYGTFPLTGASKIYGPAVPHYDLAKLKSEAQEISDGPLGQALAQFEHDVLELQKNLDSPDKMHAAQHSWTALRNQLSQLKLETHKMKTGTAPINREKLLMRSSFAYFFSNTLIPAGFLDFEKIPTAESAAQASVAILECREGLNALQQMEKILLPRDHLADILDIGDVLRWDLIRGGIAVLAGLPEDIKDEELERQMPWINYFGRETLVEADRKKPTDAVMVRLYELFIGHPQTLRRLLNAWGVDLLRRNIVDEPELLRATLEKDVALQSPDYQRQMAWQEVFERVNGIEISTSVRPRLHRLNVKYNAAKNTWDFQLRPLYGVAGQLTRWHIPWGPISGEGSLLFHYDPHGSSFQILSNVNIRPAYVGLRLYTKIIDALWDKLPEPTIVWQMAHEHDTLESFYNALPEKVGYRDRDTDGSYPSAKTLIVRWKEKGRDSASITTELRHKVWQALMLPTPAVIAPEVIAETKMGRPLYKDSKKALSVVAGPGGEIWIRAAKGTPLAPDEGPRFLGEEWLKYFHANLENSHHALMRTRIEEEKVRAWERLFVSRFYDRFEMPASELLIEIRTFLATGAIDTWEVDTFLDQLSPVPDQTWNKAYILRQFRHFLSTRDYMVLLQSGHAPVIIGHPEIEKAFRLKSYDGHAIFFSSPSAYWASRLAHDVDETQVLRWVHLLSQALQDSHRERLRNIEGKTETLERLHRLRSPSGNTNYSKTHEMLTLEIERTGATIHHLREGAYQDEMDQTLNFISMVIMDILSTRTKEEPLPLLIKAIGLLTFNPSSAVHNALYELSNRLLVATSKPSEISFVFNRNLNQLTQKLEHLRKAKRMPHEETKISEEKMRLNRDAAWLRAVQKIIYPYLFKPRLPLKGTLAQSA